MIKDQKDDIIITLKRKNTDLEEQIKLLTKTNGEFKKGDSLAENKIKALEEMHAQKIKTLLKSIQILKKEV
jgi:phage host-nuclease inhibitor protein Gam